MSSNVKRLSDSFKKTVEAIWGWVFPSAVAYGALSLIITGLYALVVKENTWDLRVRSLRHFRTYPEGELLRLKLRDENWEEKVVDISKYMYRQGGAFVFTIVPRNSEGKRYVDLADKADISLIPHFPGMNLPHAPSSRLKGIPDDSAVLVFGPGFQSIIISPSWSVDRSYKASGALLQKFSERVNGNQNFYGVYETKGDGTNNVVAYRPFELLPVVSRPGASERVLSLAPSPSAPATNAVQSAVNTPAP